MIYNEFIKEKNEMKLIIKQSSWAGEPDYIPQETENSYDVKIGEKYTIKTREHSFKEGDEWKKKNVEILSFEIINIEENSIRIHTFQPFSDKEKGIDLLSKKQDFAININSPLKLTTPTMDAGDIFILSLTN